MHHITNSKCLPSEKVTCSFGTVEGPSGTASAIQSPVGSPDSELQMGLRYVGNPHRTAAVQLLA
jgi:hypothetical protein